MVEVFKTNIADEVIAASLAQELAALFPGTTITFDLEDCDRIMRVDGLQVIPGNIAAVLLRHGHLCEMLH